MKNRHFTISMGICLLAMIFPVVFFSCDILRDSPFEVEAWSPGAGYHARPEILEVSLLLSHESDRVKVEEAFSLTEDGKSVKGLFSWQGNRFCFKPASPLEQDREYLVSLGTGAQDTKGLSLERKFEASFTTRLRNIRPKVISVEPAYDGVISNSRDMVKIVFTEEVNVNSCINSISFSPSVNGRWNIEGEGKTACFSPLGPWKTGIQYKITIADSMQSASGCTIGEEFLSRFSIAINNDDIHPFIISAWALNPGEVPDELSPLDIYNPDKGFFEWESFTKLMLEFSEPVDTGSIKSHLTIEPQASLVLETPPGFSSTAVFSFAEKPAWNKDFLFISSPGVKDEAGNESLDEKAFRIRTNGPHSKPPSLIGIRLPMAPGNKDNPEPSVYSMNDIFSDLPMDIEADSYPYAKAIPVWIELYFETAMDTEINTFSLMELFKVESTNNAVSFSPRNIKNKDFALPDAVPGWENHCRIEMEGLMTNTVNSGVVSFYIRAGLEDLKGNKSPEIHKISLLK
ncbi:Ig-like domain-containing protein [Leadbettera azotonutricia]|uniref:Putative lipoprotein n=1 Tax=Leadbettera azotonutricia (strain ATCC BAA-888 / DSM 13862 / ZAS-9) TaxID=545695 RepID=F5Y6N3_LEAAZ|nr:Ig-like domain-containing protein [Leadbettera azotonutricia]AEF82200.1 putative lipoprotein [Leadbettera azotonutricia ZAS-9]